MNVVELPASYYKLAWHLPWWRESVRQSQKRESWQPCSRFWLKIDLNPDSDLTVLLYPDVGVFSLQYLQQSCCVLSAGLFFSAGTIWMQEILPLVLNGGDLTPIRTIPNWDRVPWLEEKRLALVVDQLTSPRALVTHFPYHLMPPTFHTSKAKVSGWRLCAILKCEPLFCASRSSAALRYWIIVHEQTGSMSPGSSSTYPFDLLCYWICLHRQSMSWGTLRTS